MLPPYSITPKWLQADFPNYIISHLCYLSPFPNIKLSLVPFLYFQSCLLFPQANKYNCVYSENICSLAQLFPEPLDCLQIPCYGWIWFLLSKGSSVGGLVHNGWN